jgi:ABC-type transport system involved in multi-copper enzyme maturation permease subunit
MSIIGSTVKTGTTAVSVAGGSDITFALTGQSVTNGLNVSVVEDSDYQTRRNATFKSRVPSITNGVYSKGKNEVVFVKPSVLADGSTVFNSIRLSLEVHPALTSAEVTDLRRVGAQLLTAAAYDSFWSLGALS